MSKAFLKKFKFLSNVRVNASGNSKFDHSVVVEEGSQLMGHHLPLVIDVGKKCQKSV